MAKSKKTKIHKKVNGQLLQMNKTFQNLKMKQKDKITAWFYEEYKSYVVEHDKIPGIIEDEHIIFAVIKKIDKAEIWIPDDEVAKYYQTHKQKMQKRLENEKKLKFKSYVDFYKSIVDQDRSAVVICNLKHEIIYMNPAAVSNYQKWGGDKLIGQSIMDCHNEKSQEKMKQVVAWFAQSPEHNIVYTFHNEKQNKDVYMVALRDEDKLIGYYEKHEYRNPETMKLYDISDDNAYQFYGHEAAGTVKAKNDSYPGIKTPVDLYEALSQIWCADTCAPRMREEWTPDNKTLGQCSITAFLAQDIFGGEVYGLTTKSGGIHCYNVVDGVTFDLTSEQFGEDAATLVYVDNPVQDRESDYHFGKAEKRERYEYLKQKLKRGNK